MRAIQPQLPHMSMDSNLALIHGVEGQPAGQHSLATAEAGTTENMAPNLQDHFRNKYWLSLNPGGMNSHAFFQTSTQRSFADSPPAWRRLQRRVSVGPYPIVRPVEVAAL
jgi:hypothetical protein